MSERWSVALSLRLPFHRSLFKFPSSVATTSSSRTDRKLKHENTQIMKTIVIKRHVCMCVCIYMCMCVHVCLYYVFVCVGMCGTEREVGGGGGKRESIWAPAQNLTQ